MYALATLARAAARRRLGPEPDLAKPIACAAVDDAVSVRTPPTVPLPRHGLRTGDLVRGMDAVPSFRPEVGPPDRRSKAAFDRAKRSFHRIEAFVRR
jgi:hypothetical protein